MGTKKKPGKVAARGKRSSPRPTPPPFANASRARARGAAPKPAPPAAPAAPAEPPKIGRPSIKTPEVLDRICEWIANGQTLRSFCRLPGSPSFVAVYEWKDADPEFKARYERAREIGAALLHEEILDIANNTHQGKTVTTEFANMTAGVTHNPLNLAHSPGGSSSGSDRPGGGSGSRES